MEPAASFEVGSAPWSYRSATIQYHFAKYWA
jgi:hypothetical protein